MTAPIQPQFRETMNALAGGLDKIFNGDAKGDDRSVGFVLLTFNFGGTEGGRVNYISNAERGEMLTAMREWLARAEGRAVDHGSRQ